MKQEECRYFGCSKLEIIKRVKNKKKWKERHGIYCKVHLEMSEKLDSLAKKVNRTRKCFYPDCNTILTQYNRGFYCFLHSQKVTFERDGLKPFAKEEVKEDSQWDKMIQSVM